MAAPMPRVEVTIGRLQILKHKVRTFLARLEKLHSHHIIDILDTYVWRSGLRWSPRLLTLHNVFV